MSATPELQGAKVIDATAIFERVRRQVRARRGLPVTLVIYRAPQPPQDCA